MVLLGLLEERFKCCNLSISWSGTQTAGLAFGGDGPPVVHDYRRI
jgi:hypothetical protein